MIRSRIARAGHAADPGDGGGDAAAARASCARCSRANRRAEIEREKVQTVDGKTLEGEVLNQGFDDLQLRTDDQRVHLLRRVGERFREVTSSVDWPGYNGDAGGNRYTTLTQINKANVARMAPKWTFTLPNTGRLQVTPVVVGGIMYVSAANECYALDAGTGRQIWHYRRPLTRGTAARHDESRRRHGWAIASSWRPTTRT